MISQGVPVQVVYGNPPFGPHQHHWSWTVKRETLKIIISLENVIKSFSTLPKTWQFNEHPQGTGCEGRNLPSSEAGTEPCPSPSAQQLLEVFLPGLPFTSHTWHHTHCHCLLPVLAGHSGYPWRIKDVSSPDPGKISNRKKVNISLCVKNRPLHNRKHLTGMKHTQRDASQKLLCNRCRF